MCFGVLLPIVLVLIWRVSLLMNGFRDPRAPEGLIWSRLSLTSQRLRKITTVGLVHSGLLNLPQLARKSDRLWSVNATRRWPGGRFLLVLPRHAIYTLASQYVIFCFNLISLTLLRRPRFTRSPDFRCGLSWLSSALTFPITIVLTCYG